MMIQPFLNLLPAGIPKDAVILDVGSLHGEQSCEFAISFPGSRIFAFEARPESAAIVRHNVSAFENIEVVEAAVCDRDGEIAFHSVSEGNPGASSLFVATGHNDVAPMRQLEETVAAIRLDSWAASQGINRFDVVWMDLQGAELLALRGMGHLLQTVRALQVEVTYRELYANQAMWPEVRAFLETAGMRLVAEWMDRSRYFGDAVFIRE